MPRVQLPPRVLGLSDGNNRIMAERGAGSFVNIDDTDPAGQRALRKLKARTMPQRPCGCGPGEVLRQAGTRGALVPWLQHALAPLDEGLLPCGLETIPESEMARERPAGPYVP